MVHFLSLFTATPIIDHISIRFIPLSRNTSTMEKKKQEQENVGGNEDNADVIEINESTDTPKVIIECLISYLDPSTAGVVRNKERKRIQVASDIGYKSVISEISKQCGIPKEAEGRGLGSNVDIKIAHLVKVEGAAKAYATSTEDGWRLERDQLLNSEDQCLQGMSRNYHK